MGTPANETTAPGVPVINTGTRKDVPTYHVLRKEDGEMCTRADLQVRLCRLSDLVPYCHNR